MRYTVEFAVKQLACGSWFLLSFEHFDVISTVDKSTDHGKLLSVSEFYSNATLKVLTSSRDWHLYIPIKSEFPARGGTVVLARWRGNYLRVRNIAMI